MKTKEEMIEIIDRLFPPCTCMSTKKEKIKCKAGWTEPYFSDAFNQLLKKELGL